MTNVAGFVTHITITTSDNTEKDIEDSGIDDVKAILLWLKAQSV